MFIPFPLIFVFIGGVFYFILASFNPRPEITLSSDIIRLGDHVAFTWTTAGNVNKIQNFKLTLIGEESATYRRGTDTCTDNHVFYSRELVNTSHPQAMQKGDAAFVIPAGAMHSFKSENNAVTWKIRMHCAVPMWPDTREKFEITVFPLALDDV